MPVSVPDSYVYLDWAATAPLSVEAAEAMGPYLQPGSGNLRLNANANSLHAPGRAAFEALELARRSFARAIGAARPSEVIFTSGATEADNTALLGMAQAAYRARERARTGGFTPHAIVSSVEHEAVLEPAARLRQLGWRVTLIDPDRAGFVTRERLERVLDDDTVMVSVQMANSEVGAIQPIAQLAQASHEAGALFHTDAVQALGKVPIDVRALGVDAASFSAHKVGGPKGVGALYVATRLPFEGYALGGGQEQGRRSGTQNVCGIAGFVAATEAALARLEAEGRRQRALRDRLYQRLSSIPQVTATVSVEPASQDYLPNVVHVLVDGFESETLVLRLDMLGFGVSGGSACASHSLEPSHVLKAMGVQGDAAYGALRVSFGHLTSQDDLDRFAEALGSCLEWNEGR
ncbi:cysteine desulfurase [Eggerthellaceae bacterium zg-1084]|uniref:cysteine desulfurase family protein n=1 Tax=Berryella wangjianweii TaxID=2734634 RepID=UPI001555F44D|nr:cysteine desulfurase family protein [Berryella wangjianweii]NPD31234.1 cysteine desulfurase [Berryella wangjianweii]